MQQKIGKQFPEARLIQALNDFAALAQVKRAEQADLKVRVESAIRSARGALEHGVVPGGGAALLACRPALRCLELGPAESVGVAALTHALAVSLRGKARVNAIAPGWIDTTGTAFEGPDALQHPVGRVGEPEDILQAALFLLGENSRFITGQTLVVDGGMSRLMIDHGDQGWRYDGQG